MKKAILFATIFSMSVIGNFIVKPAYADKSIQSDINKCVTGASAIGGYATTSGATATASGLPAVGVGVVGLGAGIMMGECIEGTTGAGSAAGDWVYNNSNPETAKQAADQLEEAKESFNNGEYLKGTSEGLKGLGTMGQGLFEGLFDR